jgi:hypothetical protein
LLGIVGVSGNVPVLSGLARVVALGLSLTSSGSLVTSGLSGSLVSHVGCWRIALYGQAGTGSGEGETGGGEAGGGSCQYTREMRIGE